MLQNDLYKKWSEE